MEVLKNEKQIHKRLCSFLGDSRFFQTCYHQARLQRDPLLPKRGRQTQSQTGKVTTAPAM